MAQMAQMNADSKMPEYPQLGRARGRPSAGHRAGSRDRRNEPLLNRLRFIPVVSRPGPRREAPHAHAAIDVICVNLRHLRLPSRYLPLYSASVTFCSQRVSPLKPTFTWIRWVCGTAPCQCSIFGPV